MNTLFGNKATPALFSGWGISNYSNASDWNTWPDGFMSPENVYDGTVGFGADWWSATSGATGLDYISTILHDGMTGKTCLAVGAATPTGRTNNTWNFPLSCVTGGFDDADGTSLALDPGGGTTVWIAQEGPDPGANMFIVQNCTADFGTTSCTISFKVNVPNALGHPVVTVNPCTHEGILAYRNTAGEIHLRSYQDNGVLTQDLITRTGARKEIENEEPTSPCVNDPASGLIPRCGQGDLLQCDGPAQNGKGKAGCLFQVSKVQVATQAIGNQCFAYVGYDSSHTSTKDGLVYMRSNLDVVDITNSGGATELFGYRDAPEDATFNSFGTVTAAADTATDGGAFPVGWFFYTQFKNDPCETGFKAVVSIDQMTSLSGMTVLETTETSFPTVRFAPLGNEYVGTIKRGLPQGILYPTWYQPIPMSSGSCVACGAEQLSSAVMATRIHVP